LSSTAATVALHATAIDKDKGRISLSMKQLEDDPWENVARDFPVGKEALG
jgi:small subunit ribosomal protein S1